MYAENGNLSAGQARSEGEAVSGGEDFFFLLSFSRLLPNSEMLVVAGAVV